MTIEKNNSRKKEEELVMSIDLSKEVVAQVGNNITVLIAEMFKRNSPRYFSKIRVGIKTNLYLDMILDIDKNELDKSSMYFTDSFIGDYEKIVNESESKTNYLFFDDGMLCFIDKEFNEKIIKENYYE